MKIRQALLVYKKSTYEIYFRRQRQSFFSKDGEFSRFEFGRLQRAHREHYKTLWHVEDVLHKLNVKYTKRWRGSKLNFTPYDFVITVGGDGTFLEAARGVTRQIILGVNSDPTRSIGRFCAADRKTFERKIREVLGHKAKVVKFHRIKLEIDGHTPVNVLNDILVAHNNPAAMSRYRLTLNGRCEEQHSSGIWIATAAGSSGAILSAGGKPMDLKSKTIQYWPRELHCRPELKIRLRGGIVSLKRPIIVQSLMRYGAIYVDGSHLIYTFPFGHKARVSPSKNTLNVIAR